MTSQLTKTNTDFIGSYEIDKLIKKFSHSMKTSNDDANSSSLNSNSASKSKAKNSPDSDSNKNQLIESICRENSQRVRNTSDQAVNDRAKFFNTLKSLFAIFDPECRGFIDINELTNLGAQRNEILNDVICYLQNKKTPNYEYSNSLYFINTKTAVNSKSIDSSSSGNSSRSSSANSSQLKSEDSKNSLLKNLKSYSKKEIGSPASIKLAKKLKKLEAKAFSSSSASPSSTKSSLSSSNNNLANNLEGYYVTFEEFVNAADIVLEKRKKFKLEMQMQTQNNYNNSNSNINSNTNPTQFRSFSFMEDKQSHNLNDSNCESASSFINGNLSSNLYQGASTSLNNIYKPNTGYVNKLSIMHSTMQPPPPPPPPIDYNTQPRPKIHNPRLSLSTHLNQHSNYMPLLNALQNHNIQTSSSSSINSTNGPTLSQAFENGVNSDRNQNISKSAHSITNKSVITSEVSNFMNNANSFDLNGLIDKENMLLCQGLADIENIKKWYTNQLQENRMKQSNINQLKRQNLFSIDKMLIDLKNLSDLNNAFNQFLKKEKDDIYENSDEKKIDNFTSDSSSQFPCMSNVQTPLPTYKDYVESFDLNKNDTDIDLYLKEKSDKIDNLQREKSNLIRRLFEMKSESANLSRNLVQLQNNQTTKLSNFASPSLHFNSNMSNTSNLTIKHHQNYERLPSNDQIVSTRPNHPNTNPHIHNNKLLSKSGVSSNRASLNHSTICNFIELPNAGIIRGSEINEHPVQRYYQPQKQFQQNFQPVHTRSPI